MARRHRFQQPRTRLVHLPCYGMTIRLFRKNSSQRPGCGVITSDLKRGTGLYVDGRHYAAIDGLESLILAHACAGLDVGSSAYVEGIETAVEAIFNRMS